MGQPEFKLGAKVTCPICSKNFVITQETCCIAKGGYVYDWKCFNTHVKKTTAEKENNLKK